MSKNYTKPTYKIEVFPVIEHSEVHGRFLNLFEQVRREWCDKFGWPRETIKGVVRIVK